MPLQTHVFVCGDAKCIKRLPGWKKNEKRTSLRKTASNLGGQTGHFESKATRSEEEPYVPRHL